MAFEAKKELILCGQAETRAKRRNRGILMYVCMWTTADPLENTGRLSPHVFVLWPFCNWPVVSADCLPQLPWRGKAVEGIDRNCQSGGEKELGIDDPIMCLFTLPLDPPHYRMLFCFSTLSFRNLKYAITEDFRNVPSVWEACSLGISRPCVTVGQRETVKWICLIWGSVFKCESIWHTVIGKNNEIWFMKD